MTMDANLLATAVWLGSHALAIFFTLQVLLAGATWDGVWVLRRLGQQQVAGNSSTRSAPALVSIRLACGAIGVGVAVFAILALQLGASGSALHQFDQALSHELGTTLPQQALWVFGLITHLGDTATLTALCLVVAVWLAESGRQGMALGWALALAGNGMLNLILKQLFSRARPLLPASGSVEPGYSFPSGHSSGAVVACGMLAYLALRLLPPRWQGPVLPIAVALALAVGASRVFLRVHFASDVLAGFASGAVWLTLCISGLEVSRRRSG
jgi:undecaprenyl-diphosphatase